MIVSAPIASDPLEPIRRMLQAGNRKPAQRSLRVLLRRQPSAAAWVLAAQACRSDDEAIYCLRQALTLEPGYSLARRWLLRLESVPRAPSVHQASFSKQRNARRPRLKVILLMLLAGITPMAVATMNMTGVITGPVTAVTFLTGGGAPIHEINGRPISQIENAPLLVTPSQTKALNTQDVDVIEPGYAHDYTFVGDQGTDVAIYVQFLSVAANRVSRNVIVLRPDGSDATPTCDRDAILDGDNGVTFTCSLDANGTWSIRVLGRAQESQGAYFIGEQALQ